MIFRVFLILLLTSTIDSFAQKQKRIDLYLESLKYYYAYMDTISPQIKEFFFENNEETTIDFPQFINEKKVTIIHLENQGKIFKKNNKKLRVIRVSPIKVLQDKIEIVFSFWSADFKGNGHYYYVLSDHLSFQYFFDCNENTFKFFQILK